MPSIFTNVRRHKRKSLSRHRQCREPTVLRVTFFCIPIGFHECLLLFLAVWSDPGTEARQCSFSTHCLTVRRSANHICRNGPDCFAKIPFHDEQGVFEYPVWSTFDLLEIQPGCILASEVVVSCRFPFSQLAWRERFRNHKRLARPCQTKLN